MLDIVRNNKRVTQVFLALITLPFAFWGVESYVRNVDRDPELASVGRSKITRQEMQATLREQQERMRTQLGGKADPATLDTPQMRRAVLDSLVTQHLLAEQARQSKVVVSNEQLVQFIASVPSLRTRAEMSSNRSKGAVAAIAGAPQRLASASTCEIVATSTESSTGLTR